MKIFVPGLLSLFIAAQAIAQNLSSKSNDLSFDFSDSKKNYASSLPLISWSSPENETTFQQEGKMAIEASVVSKHLLKSVTLIIRDKESNEVKGQLNVPVTGDKLNVKISRNITLMDGINELEIIAENTDGLKSAEKKYVHVGATILADASKLNRKDYALIFVTDKYDNWTQLVNPVFDGRTIADNLEKNYGFQTDVIENPTREQVFVKLREYAEKKYEQMDQLFIFFAGHGFYDETFKEGFVVPRESLPDDPGRTSYIRHSELRTTINNNPCEHIFLMMDVCFGGTFDEYASSRSGAELYQEASQAEIITRKLKYKTRKYITSGGKQYVSDGIPGKHSPFAKQIIDAFESMGGNDGILTLSEMLIRVEKLKTAPQYGSFGNDAQGSEFVFVVKGK